MNVAVTWPLTRTLSYLLQGTAAGFALYEHLFSNTRVVEPALEWRKCVLRFARTGIDDAVTSIDLLNITSSAVDPSWITGDYTTCETLLDAFVTAYKPYMSSSTSLVEYRWYRAAFNPSTDARPFAPAILPERLSTKSLAGTGTLQTLPRQCACVITEKTPLPRHWGRLYMPCDGVSTALTVTGELPSASVSAIAAAAETLYEGLWAANFIPVVPVTQVNRDPSRGLLNVTAVKVDSVIDIQRRRRRETSTFSDNRVIN